MSLGGGATRILTEINVPAAAARKSARSSGPGNRTLPSSGGREDWFKQADTTTRDSLVSLIDAWLDDKPAWDEDEYFYRTGTAQGAAYDHFLGESERVLDALSIAIIEGY